MGIRRGAGSSVPEAAARGMKPVGRARGSDDGRILHGMGAARFPIRLGARSRPLLRLFGARPDNSYVDVDADFDARFGRFRVTTPFDNIASWRIEGPWRWITAVGVRRSVRHGDVTFGGNHRGGVRVDFREPVRLSRLHVPALYVTVEDMEGLGGALAARGIPGEDVRKGARPT